MGVVQGAEDQRVSQRFKAVERPEGMDASEGILARFEEVFQQGDGRPVTAIDQEALGGVAPPAVGLVQGRDELGQIGMTELGSLVRSSVVSVAAADPPEAAGLGAFAEVDRGAHRLGDEGGMLDQRGPKSTT